MGLSVFPAAGGGVTMKVQEFTSTGSFTVPSNCTSVSVFAVGGGGGGGYHRVVNTGANPGAAGGGGGGEVIKRDITVTAGSTYTITIGAGGAGGNGTNAGSGGNTTFGSLLTAKGGGGGCGWDYSPAVLYKGTSGGTGGGGIGISPNNSFWISGGGGGAGGNAFFGGQLITGTNGNGVTQTYSMGGSASQSYSVNRHEAFSSGAGGHGYVLGQYNAAGSLPTSGGSPNQNQLSFAGAGIDGYGAGGPGGGYVNGYAPCFSQGGVLAVGGTGGNETGNSASANTGAGGGGGSAYSAGAPGGSGGSGYMRITYWS